MKFDLDKSTAKAKFTLEKKGLPSVRAAVVLNLDVSGSARGLFHDGDMQNFFQLVCPLALLFDDNKELDVFTFASGESYTTHIQPNADANNFADYIRENILNDNSVNKWGGTSYAPIIKSNLEALGFYKKAGIFSGKKLVNDNGSGYPALIITATDGANDDHSDTMEILRQCEEAKVNAYFLFVGLGNASFPNIIKYGDVYPNVGFVSVKDIAKFAGSDDVYDQLLPQELTEWFAKTKK